jgi:hypothetical protein
MLAESSVIMHEPISTDSEYLREGFDQGSPHTTTVQFEFSNPGEKARGPH